MVGAIARNKQRTDTRRAAREIHELCRSTLDALFTELAVAPPPVDAAAVVQLVASLYADMARPAHQSMRTLCLLYACRAMTVRPIGGVDDIRCGLLWATVG